MARNEELTRPPGSVIGRGLSIQAACLVGTDSIRVDGVITGNVELEGSLHVSENGIIEGDIHVSSARIAGRIHGNVRCRAFLHLASTATVTGDITTASMVVDEGAVLYGQCRTRVTDEETLDLPVK